MEPANNTKEDKENKAKRRYYGKIFVFLIFSLISFEYYSYVYLIMWHRLKNNNIYLITSALIIFHFLLFMMIWSLLVTMNTHPGEIPLYWGFYIGDEDYKRKRYCLICNAFKPERSHHCSVCNICVLNMDHHCPWVDNCIGFYNRKYFMQLLFYLCLLTHFMNFSELYEIYTILKDIYKGTMIYEHMIRSGFILIAYAIIITLSVLITLFFKFHVGLVIRNSTTIESLDKEHTSENAKFNLSQKENWLQVFGEDCLLWFLPIIAEKGRPKGDGLTWKTNLITENIMSNPNITPGNNVEMKNYNTNMVENYRSTSPFSPNRGSST